MKEEVKKYEEEQQQLTNQIFDLQHEQEKYSTVMKENQQKIKYYHSEVRGIDSMCTEDQGSLGIANHMRATPSCTHTVRRKIHGLGLLYCLFIWYPLFHWLDISFMRIDPGQVGMLPLAIQIVCTVAIDSLGWTGDTPAHTTQNISLVTHMSVIQLDTGSLNFNAGCRFL